MSVYDVLNNAIGYALEAQDRHQPVKQPRRVAIADGCKRAGLAQLISEIVDV
jgi:hypothetical protein